MLPAPGAPKFHIDDHFKIEIIFQFKCLGLVRPPVSIITTVFRFCHENQKQFRARGRSRYSTSQPLNVKTETFSWQYLCMRE